MLDIDFSVDRFCCCCSPLSICHPTSFWLPSFLMRNKPSLSTVVLSILHTRWVTAPSPSGFTLSLGTQSDHSVSRCGYFRVYLSWSLLSFLDDIYLSSYWGSFHLVFLKIFFPILFSFYDAHIGTLGISHILRALFIFFSFFFFFILFFFLHLGLDNFNYSVFQFIDSFFCMLASTVDPASEFFISVIVFFICRIWLLFIIWIYLFMPSLCLLHCFVILFSSLRMLSLSSLTIVRIVDLIFLTSYFNIWGSSGIVSVKYFYSHD